MEKPPLQPQPFSAPVKPTPQTPIPESLNSPTQGAVPSGTSRSNTGLANTSPSNTGLANTGLANTGAHLGAPIKDQASAFGATNTEPNRSMNLTFRLEPEDLSAFAKEAAQQNSGKNSLSSLPILLLASFAFGGLVLLALYFFQSATLTNIWFYIALALAVALVVLFVQAFSNTRALAPAIDGPSLGRRVYEIENDGLIITQNGIQQAWMWQSIRDVSETDDAIYLFVDRNAAHIFPKNVFATPIHAREFAAYIREKVALAKTVG